MFEFLSYSLSNLIGVQYKEMYHNVRNQIAKYNSLSVRQQLFKRDEQIHLPFSLLTREGMPQLICLFSISIVILDMNFGKRDHPYNKETACMEIQINCPSNI